MHYVNDYLNIECNNLDLLRNDQLGDNAQAIEWFMQLIGIVPTDATILQRLGEMYDNEGDKSQAFQYHYDVSKS